MKSYFFFEYEFFYGLISNGWLMDNSLSFGEGWGEAFELFFWRRSCTFGEIKNKIEHRFGGLSRFSRILKYQNYLT
jgi:hypothetical protein